MTLPAVVLACLAIAHGAAAQEPPSVPDSPVQPPVETPVAPPPIPEPPPGEPPSATVITDDEAAFVEGEEPAPPAPAAPVTPTAPAVAGAEASAPPDPPLSAAPVTAARGQLPFTGPHAGLLALFGALFCALGLGLRRWIAAPAGIFRA